jgi:DnaK suppressor protein
LLEYLLLAAWPVGKYGQGRLCSGSGELLLTPDCLNAQLASGAIMDRLVQRTIRGPYGPKGMVMKIVHSAISRFHEVLERKESELVQVLRKREGIAIEKSADQLDEIQYATERDLAIRNVDRESCLLRDVKDALRRIHEGAFGTCIDCESAISPKRLAAVPWAARCIQCQEAADRDRQDRRESTGATLLNAA